APTAESTPASTVAEPRNAPGEHDPRRALSGLAALAAVLALALLTTIIFATYSRGSQQHPIGQPTVPAGVVRGSDTELTKISMVSADEGWALGFRNGAGDTSHDGVVLMHFQHGAWRAVSVPFTAHLEAISLDSASDGWAVGWSGVFAHYDGYAWAPVTVQLEL